MNKDSIDINIKHLDAVTIARNLLNLPEVNTAKVSDFVYGKGMVPRSKLNQKKRGINRISLREAELIIAYYNNLNDKIVGIMQGNTTDERQNLHAY